MHRRTTRASRGPRSGGRQATSSSTHDRARRDERQRQAELGIGFYSENEFDLDNLKRLSGRLMELGRSCIASAHRSFAVVNLLWGAIARYAAANDVHFLFGCGSLHCAAVEEVQPIYSYLQARHLAPEKYRVYPRASCRMQLTDEKPSVVDEREALRRLSPILKGYLRTGAMICGAPAYDAEFGTADVLVLLEMEKLAARYKRHYGVGEQRWG